MYFTPHLDENVSFFVQIYTFYPTFGRKSFDYSEQMIIFAEKE